MDAGSTMQIISSTIARANSIILNLESDQWATRAGTLDTLAPADVEAHAMLVLERVEDEDGSVRRAAVDALMRSPAALSKYSRFIALKLINNNRQIQQLALELLDRLSAAELSKHLKKVLPLLEDKDPAIRFAASRIRDKCESSTVQATESDASRSSRSVAAPSRSATASSSGTAALSPRESTYRVNGRLVSTRR